MVAELVFGIVILLIGAEVFVRGAVALARLLKWSPLVIGATVVAIGTSTPELTVSLLAAVRDDYGLALGNIVGSNITNAFLVLAAGVAIGKIRIGTTKTPKNAWVLLASTFFYWYWHNFGDTRNLLWPYVALMGAVVFSTIEIWWAWWGKSHEDEHLTHKEVAINKYWILLIPIAIYAISVGGGFVVSSIEEMSLFYGISTTLLGLVLSSIATSLPELATTIFGVWGKQEKLVVGNILGSNIYNLLIVGGVVGIWGNGATLNFWVWMMFLLSAMFLLVIVETFKGKYLPKRLFWWLIAGFGGYLVSVF